MPRRSFTLALFACLTATFAASVVAADAADEIGFKKTQLDAAFRAEGAAVGDFNNDGKLDIAAGMVWYEAPSWKMHSIVEPTPEYDPKGYSNAFCTFADDLNGDGWTDIITVDFPGTPTWWFENPGKQADGPWKRHTCVEVSNNESPTYVDLDGDGKRELVMAFSPDTSQPDGPQRKMAFMKPDKDPYKLWHIYPISQAAAPGTRKYSHGLGVGDVNGDGRADILSAEGAWWEQPKDLTRGPWKRHDATFGSKAAQMYVYDFDGDGDNDVLASSPHAYGVWWFEQTSPNQWKQHIIDDSFSQTHGVCLGDVNGDGLMDFVTGKRWWAHGGRDPGGDQPAVFYWFELTRDGGKADWVRHQFDHNSGVGTQFELTDVNGDGLLDVVSSNKKGVYYFQQVRK
jgi:hypothetical protein